MKLTLKDKKLILYFLGIALLAISYLFVYKPQMEEVSSLEATNASLAKKLDDLMELAKNKEFYVAETEQMRQEILAYCEQFPAMVYDEDGIVLAKNMESSLDMRIRSVGTGDAELLYYLDGQAGEQPEQDDTMMEQANAQTREMINEIEGVEEEEEREVLSDFSSAALHRVLDTIQFQCTYEGLKDSVRYLASQRGRMTMNNVTASFDSDTGNLSGNMAVNLFFMTGVDGNLYTAPDAGGVAYGTDNIFGTIESLTGRDFDNGTEEAPAEGEAPPEEAPFEGEALPEGETPIEEAAPEA